MQSIIEWFSRNGRVLNRIILFLFSVAFIVYLFPREGKFKYDFQQGRPWLHEDLIAPYDFPIYKTADELEAEKKEVLENLTPVFVKDPSMVQKTKREFTQWFYQSLESDLKGVFPDSVQQNRWFTYYAGLLDSLFAVGIIEMVPIIEEKSPASLVMLRSGQEAEPREIASFYTVTSARDYIYRSEKNHRAKGAIHARLVNLLVQDVQHDQESTEKLLMNSLKKISPTRGMVQKGERIIARGDLITSDRFQILNSLKTEYGQRLGSDNSRGWIFLGQILLAIISMLAFVLFLFFFRKEILMGRRDFVLVLSTILVMIALCSLVVDIRPDYVFLVPVCLVPVIIRVFYDNNLALFSLFIVLIITGFLVPNSFEFIYLQLITGIITIITIVHFQRRSQFFFTSLVVFITYSIIYLALQMIQDVSFLEINPRIFLQFFLNGVMLLLAFPIIYIYEKLFKKVTDITLMELSDTNNRLLRILADEAPGTFQHSIMVANLAEEAVRAIGGNPLLVRTGALYHDIGKIDNSQYFVENQVGSVSPHDELSNEESAAIIKSHVILGVDRARRYKLPDQIIDFIRTHHGTGKIGYFYAMAQKEDADSAPDERIYTYPGPEPFSRETCVLMMADSVEAASRTLKEPSDSTINNLVENIVNRQIALRQFENASITFKDIAVVKEVMKHKIKNMYHVRIEYPAEALK
ncbi:MAG: HDIG domain-containing protein [Bacteroidia bacterium]|nr:HDIG domain-containing protein [Bacteroidia bacterium]